MKAGLKITVRIMGAILCIALIAVNFDPSIQAVMQLPSTVYVNNNDDFMLDCTRSGLITAGERSAYVSHSGDERLNNKTVTLKLFGIIPLKDITVFKRETRYVIPIGECIGVEVDTLGVLIVGTGDIITDSGRSIKSPSAAAGLKAGDIIISANGEQVKDTDMLTELVNKSNTQTITLKIKRGSSEFTKQVNAVKSDSGYMLGAWVRDSTAGIGTISMALPDTLVFGALGHPIVDVDTQTVFEVESGEVIDCEIMNIIKGESGEPGEIIGTFGDRSERRGIIEFNNEFGIYGRLNKKGDWLYKSGLPIGYPDEVKRGNATLITEIDKTGPKEYSCEITKTFEQHTPDSKGFIIKITDKELIKKTGGIVQGMSGSPVIQNGKVVGIVTHVMINDPTGGYCMYSKWMLDRMEKVG